MKEEKTKSRRGPINEMCRNRNKLGGVWGFFQVLGTC